MEYSQETMLNRAKIAIDTFLEKNARLPNTREYRELKSISMKTIRAYFDNCSYNEFLFEHLGYDRTLKHRIKRKSDENTDELLIAKTKEHINKFLKEHGRLPSYLEFNKISDHTYEYVKKKLAYKQGYKSFLILELKYSPKLLPIHKNSRNSDVG